MTKTHPAAANEVAPARCENCGAGLHGEFCHACGQSVHSPIRDLRHAVEEFFESFWHLDGRVFRTLRDLWVPGRVAANYIAGHRARYIAPLRLFVVLSLLTFFIGALALHVGEGATDGTGVDAIDAAGSVEEVRRIRDEAIAAIESARARGGGPMALDPALVATEARIQAAAASRIAQLTGAPSTDAAGPPTVPRPQLRLDVLGHRGEWDAETNPVAIQWLPGFANAWLNGRLGNLQKNVQTMGNTSVDTWLQALMSSAPSALFLLVPVFAIMLRVAYLFTARVYLEHLVVALYSHAFLLVMLALAFLASALGNWIGGAVAGTLSALVLGAAVMWMPVYLLLMQKRVYAQPWWLTVTKYLVIGTIYFLMLMTSTLVMFLAQLTSA